MRVVAEHVFRPIPDLELSRLLGLLFGLFLGGRIALPLPVRILLRAGLRGIVGVFPRFARVRVLRIRVLLVFAPVVVARARNCAGWL